MKNEDEECFKWAVTRALNPVDRPAKGYQGTQEAVRGIKLGRNRVPNTLSGKALQKV